MTTVARWESRKGAHYVELVEGHTGFGYRANDCGGCLASRSREEAFKELDAKLRAGYFLPDKAKWPMRRVL